MQVLSGHGHTAVQQAGKVHWGLARAGPGRTATRSGAGKCGLAWITPRLSEWKVVLKPSQPMHSQVDRLRGPIT